MKTWAIYKSEERELREFANKEAPGQEIRVENNGGMVVNIKQIEIRYQPDSKKLLFKGGEDEIMQIKHKFIKFVEKGQLERKEIVDVALKTRRH